jgi:translocator protein
MTLPTVIAALTVVFMLGVGGWMTTIGPWYQDLRKPAWNPPNRVFGPAWTVILGLAAWAGVSAWLNASSSADQARILVLFGINILLHVL